MAGTSSYPESFDALATDLSTLHPRRRVGPDVDDHAASINALQETLGVEPAGESASVAERLDALEAKLASAFFDIGEFQYAFWPGWWIDEATTPNAIAQNETGQAITLQHAVGVGNDYAESVHIYMEIAPADKSEWVSPDELGANNWLLAGGNYAVVVGLQTLIPPDWWRRYRIWSPPGVTQGGYGTDYGIEIYRTLGIGFVE